MRDMRNTFYCLKYNHFSTLTYMQMTCVVLCVVLVLLIIAVYNNICKNFLTFILIGTVLILTGFRESKPALRMGGQSNQIRDASALKNPIRQYGKYQSLIKKQFRTIGEKYTNSDFINNMMKIYKYNPKNNRWGNVSSRPALSNKFGKEIMDTINVLESGTILDYGCGDGYSLSHFGADFRKICVDVEDFRSYKECEFIKNTSLNTLNEKIEDESVDLVMMLQSLHHISFGNRSKNMIGLVLDTIVKILKPNSYLLIREHNAENNIDLYPILLEHLLFDLMEISDKSMDETQLRKWINNYHTNHAGWYFSKAYLHQLLVSRGFVLLTTENKKGLNPSFIYNSLYQKTDNHNR
jgi:SAM-dependent methyltransferase